MCVCVYEGAWICNVHVCIRIYMRPYTAFARCDAHTLAVYSWLKLYSVAHNLTIHTTIWHMLKIPSHTSSRQHVRHQNQKQLFPENQMV